MQLTTNIDIDEGIVSASVKCTDISDETKEALHDYTKVLRYGDIDFSAKIKVTNNMPEIVDDNDPDGEEVEIGLIDKSFIVDENLNLELKLDSNKMSDKELTSSISNVEILSKAKAIIWIDKVKGEIQKLVDAAREQNKANIEGTVDEVI
ncbi:MAG: hypothetical protein HFH72_16820 [Lachnospiraceae bacterium]|nr:hypothetical protein [Lachnospiraceae bacterium]